MVHAKEYQSILLQNTPYSDRTIKFLEVFRRDLAEEIGRVAQERPVTAGYIPATEEVAKMSFEHQLEHLGAAFQIVTETIESLALQEASSVQFILEMVANTPPTIIPASLLGLSGQERTRRLEAAERFHSRRSVARFLLSNLSGE